MRNRSAGCLAPLALSLGIALAACGGDSPTDPGSLLAELDPTGLQADMQEDFYVTDAVDPANELLAQALDTIADYPGVTLVAGLANGPGVLPRAAIAGSGTGGMLGIASMIGSAAAPWTAPGTALGTALGTAPGTAPVTGVLASVSFGAAAGKTFIYDPQTGRWREDPNRTGAPADGVRIIWYFTDASGGVVLPVSERGYIDLTPQDQGGVQKVGVRIVETTSGQKVVADYVEAHAVTEVAGNWSETLGVVGMMSSGSTTLEFDITGTGGGSDTGASTSTIHATFAAGPRSYTYDLNESLAAGGEAFTDDIGVTATREGKRAALTLRMQGNDATSSGTGQLSVDGRKVADIAVSDGDLSFSKPDGKAYTGSDSDRLNSLSAMMILSGFLVLLAIPLLI